MKAIARVGTEEAFWAWCNDAAPGECCEYFSGATVRHDSERKYRLPKVAWEAYELGLVVLTQRRTGDENSPFVWLATRRARNAPPPIISDGHQKTIEQTDWSTAEGAQKLAQKIEHYWHQAGHHNVRAWVERVPSRKGQSYHAVRTNPIGGLPPKADALAKVA
jgi:hypothetical protein